MDSFTITNNLNRTFDVAWSIPRGGQQNLLSSILQDDSGSTILRPGQSVTATHQVNCYRGVNVWLHGNGTLLLHHDCWRGRFVLNDYGLCAASGGHIRAWSNRP